MKQSNIIALLFGFLSNLALAQKNVGTVNTRPIQVYLTAENTDRRLSKIPDITFFPLPQPDESEACVFVDKQKTFQDFIGVGGAITDAAAETFAKLPASVQETILKAYYDQKEGIGYSLARTNIQSCDFSSSSYSYVGENDVSLKSFSVAHDEKYRIPLILKAIQTTGGKLTLFASPWSPPAWMKSNHNVLNGGKLLPQFYQQWADMYVKFIDSYEKKGVPIWGMTVQNEPMAAQPWESCEYTADEERNFVKNYLGKTLNAAGLGNKKIIIWDHNRDLMYQRASTILNDPDAAKYVWGTGFHWYSHDTYNNVKLVKEAFPEKQLLFTEGCSERFKLASINDWKWGEMYGKAMINDFNNGASGWTDWNILLDQTGGPNHAYNFCFAPVHADTNTGKLTFMNSFYYIGHFSKFIRPGAKRIVSSSNRDELLSTAFLNADGSVIVIVLNLTEHDLPFSLWMNEKSAKTLSPAHSIMTLII